MCVHVCAHILACMRVHCVHVCPCFYVYMLLCVHACMSACFFALELPLIFFFALKATGGNSCV